MKRNWRTGTNALPLAMAQDLLTIRRAEPQDARAIAQVHDASWREAYRGVIPGVSLEAMIMRRGAQWWLSAIKHGSHILLLELGREIAGYVSYGRNRYKPLPYAGEIFELYLTPHCQGLGFGEKLFTVARADLVENGYFSTITWALADNERAIRFYKKMGGAEIWRGSERFGSDSLARVAFGFAAP